jgi:hypothetical protein
MNNVDPASADSHGVSERPLDHSPLGSESNGLHKPEGTRTGPILIGRLAVVAGTASVLHLLAVYLVLQEPT